VAFDKATGAQVWDTTPSGRPVAAPMTYLHNGVQYIVVATGLGPSAELVAYALER
jgi:glucose dehydrogenase